MAPQTLGLSLQEYLRACSATGLSSLPGTAAEILDDEVRALICPGQDQHRAVAGGDARRACASACAAPPPSCSATRIIRAIGRAICSLSERCSRTPAASPNSYRCRSCTWRRRCGGAVCARSGPSFREAVLMHAVARLVLNPWIHNIQASWVKMGTDGAALLPARRRQRSGRHVDERIDHARCRRRQRSRAGTQAYRSRGRRGRTTGAPANDILW